MRYSKPLPSLDRLNELFAYAPETGDLFRRQKDGTLKKCAPNQHASHPHVVADGTNYLLHRLCFAVGNQRMPTKEVDHKDGDSRNNRLDNLREATSAENNRNRRISVRNKSGVKGVHWSARHQRWLAIITVNYRPIYLGLHESIDLAAAALAKHREKFHGEFANDGNIRKAA